MPDIRPRPEQRKKEKGREEKRKTIPRRRHAFTRQNAGMAGLEQWGRAAVPPPSEAAARRAAW